MSYSDEQLKKDLPYVLGYCLRYGVKIAKIGFTSENFLGLENYYVFNDSRGGYTRKGLLNTFNDREWLGPLLN